LRALSLCTCCRHYPGAADELQTSLKLARLYQPSPKWVSGRPAHRPFRGLLSVHSRCGLHTRTVTYVTVIRGLQTLRYLHACPGCFRLELLAGWDSHPLEKVAFARRTPIFDTRGLFPPFQLRPLVHVAGAPIERLELGRSAIREPRGEGRLLAGADTSGFAASRSRTRKPGGCCRPIENCGRSRRTTDVLIPMRKTWPSSSMLDPCKHQRQFLRRGYP
jgi:hypothetical protein